jgi:APA family basic amino acid/polyamine antiporter
MEQEKKLLNLFDIFCLGLGGAIGSGIFVLLGLGIGFTGRSIVLVVSIGCVFMLLAYMYNLVLSSMFKLQGGDYSQKAMLFNPTLTGISAVFTLMNGFSLSMYAVAIVDYSSMIFPGITVYTKPLAVVIMTLFFATGIKGSKFMATVNSIMTIILMLSIAVFIIVGLPQLQPGYFSGEGFFTGGVPGFFAAISIMGWACQGTTMSPVAMSGVTKNSKKTVPTGILLIVVALAAIYGLMSMVAAGVLPLEQVSGQNLSATAKTIFPYGIYVIFILGGAVFAIATSLMGAIAMLRHPIQQIAEDGWLPAVFKKTTKGGYPYVSQALFYTVSILPILLDFSLDAVVSLVMIPTMLLNIYLNFGCIGLVKKYPEHWKRSLIHMPNGIFTVVMLLSCVCAGIVAYNLFVGMAAREMLMVVGMLAVCVAVALIRLKTGAVSVADLEAKKKAIIEEALLSK